MPAIPRFARLCENSDSNAIPEKPSLIHRAGATISIGGMILVSPFSPSVRVFTQSREAKDPRHPGRGISLGTTKILRLTAQDDNCLTAQDDNCLTAQDDNAFTTSPARVYSPR